jgi:hypothetical protein
MAISQVGNSKVYIVDAQVPVAKTSRGEGYGFFVTNLRWQLWEEIQKNEAASIGFDEKVYLSNLKLIQDQIKQQRELIAQVQSGELKSRDTALRDQKNNSVDLRQSAISAESASRPTTSISSSVGTVSTAKIEQDKALTSEDEQQVQGATQGASARSNNGKDFPAYTSELIAGMERALGVGGGFKDNDKARNRAMEDLIDKGKAAGLTEQQVLNTVPFEYAAAFNKHHPSDVPSGVESRTTKTVSSKGPMPKVDISVDVADIASREEELKRLKEELASLETKASLLSAPNTDLLQRSRASFSSNIGEGGFGLDSRPRRELPMFDEDKAVGDVKSVLDFFIAEEVNAFSSKAKSDQEAADPGSKESTEPDAKVSKKKPSGPLSLDQARTLGIQKGLSFLRSQGATDTQEGAFLLKDKYVPQEQPAPDAPLPRTERIRTEPYVKPESTPVLEEAFGVPKAPVVKPRSLNELDYIMGTERPASTLPAQIQDPLISKEAWERFGAMTSSTPNEVADLTQDQKDSDLYSRTQSLNQRPVERPTIAPSVQPIPVQPSAPVEAPKPASVPLKITTGSDVKEIMDLKRKAKEDLEGKLLLEDTQSKKTTQERRSTYQVDVVMNAQKLAAQPKKLERLAKSALPTEKRLEYVVLVDRLYDANRSAGTEPVAPAYAEINRVYSKDPDTRKKAQSYLLAKSMLDEQVQKPV